MVDCVICEKTFETNKSVSISRCCCWEDEICPECVGTKSLKDYLRAIGLYRDEPFTI